jgi:hypothetical protein
MRYVVATVLVGLAAAIGVGTASADIHGPSGYCAASYCSSYYTPSYYTPTYSSYYTPTYYPTYSTPTYMPIVPTYRVPSYGLSDYGRISTVTGLPRTHWVNPYFRSNGTYVHGYYRSCSYCRY